VRKELKTNILVVTNDPKDKALETRQIEIHSVNWITEPKKFPYKAKGRYRHQQELRPLAIDKVGKGRYIVKFAQSQLAVASGQSLVLYDENICIGGGVIG
jgi:tRNA-specific 2-thiouridylase